MTSMSPLGKRLAQVVYQGASSAHRHNNSSHYAPLSDIVLNHLQIGIPYQTDNAVIRFDVKPAGEVAVHRLGLCDLAFSIPSIIHSIHPQESEVLA